MDKLPDDVEPAAVPLYVAIARALTAWEMFEFTLANIYLALIESRSVAALRAYGFIASFQGRLDMIREASNVYFTYRGTPELKERVRQVLIEAHELAKHRNEIAHGVVNKTFSAEQAGRFTIIPALYNARKISVLSDLKYEHSASAVDEFRIRFGELKRKALDLESDISDEQRSSRGRNT